MELQRIDTERNLKVTYIKNTFVCDVALEIKYSFWYTEKHKYFIHLSPR